MSKDADPRFRNSKFLSFLKKVQTGEYELTNDNKLVEHPEKAQATAELDAKMDALNAGWDQAVNQDAQDQVKMQNMNAAFVDAHNKVLVEDAKLEQMDEHFDNATKEVEEEIKARADRKAKELQ